MTLDILDHIGEFLEEHVLIVLAIACAVLIWAEAPLSVKPYAIGIALFFLIIVVVRILKK